jgi:ABC-type glycerol-3-phosphate transport system substrate-binding protein
LQPFPAQAETLRLLTLGSYAPDELVKKFEAKYPDITVEVTFSNNEGNGRQAARHRRRRF